MTAIANTRTLPESARRTAPARSAPPGRRRGLIDDDATEHGRADDVRDELPDDSNAVRLRRPVPVPRQQPPAHPGRASTWSSPRCACSCAFAGTDSPASVNDGLLWAAWLLTVAGVISITSGWRMHVDETEALVAAQRAVGFPVGHASAQQVWRGLRSRPTWRVLCYSAEDPPAAARSGARRRGRRHRGRSSSSRTTPNAGAPRRSFDARCVTLGYGRRSCRDPSPSGSGGAVAPSPAAARRACSAAARSWARRSRSSNSTEWSERVFERTNEVETPLSSSRGRRAPRRASRAGRADGAAPCARARRARR